MSQQSNELMIYQFNEPMCHPYTSPQAHDDETMLRLWLDGKAAHTQRAYTADVNAFLAHIGRPLRTAAVGDVQVYGAKVAHLAPVSRARKLGSVKSLLSFAHRLGYVAFNIGAVVRLPPVKETLAERIIPEGNVHRLLALEVNPRNHALLRLLYVAGLRISEASNLRWRDLAGRDDAGQVTIMGKGGQTGAILLPVLLWRELAGLRGDAGTDAPVFLSAKGGHLDPVQVHRIVKAAAARAGLPAALSAHWLRHAHASHALDHGAPIHLVQATLRHSSVTITGRYLHARPNDSSARYLGA